MGIDMTYRGFILRAGKPTLVKAKIISGFTMRVEDPTDGASWNMSRHEVFHSREEALTFEVKGLERIHQQNLHEIESLTRETENLAATIQVLRDRLKQAKADDRRDDETANERMQASKERNA